MSTSTTTIAQSKTAQNITSREVTQFFHALKGLAETNQELKPVVAQFNNLTMGRKKKVIVDLRSNEDFCRLLSAKTYDPRTYDRNHEAISLTVSVTVSQNERRK